jgi:hypothetical protein
MNAIQSAARCALLGALTSTLYACSPEQPKARYTVDEYLANPSVMDAKLTECASNPGDLRNDPDCVNVRAAVERRGVGSLRDLAPMGLAPPEKHGPADQRGSSAEPER